MALLSPCYKCPEREINCHDTCLKYACYKVEVEKFHKKRDLDSVFQGYFQDETYKNWKAREGTKRKTAYY